MKRRPYWALFFVIALTIFAFPFVATAQDGGDRIEFNQLETEDGLLSLLYPAAWTVESTPESGSIFLTNNVAIIDRTEVAPFDSGDVSVMLTFIPTDYAHLFGFEGDTLEEKLSGIVDGLLIIHTDTDGNENLSVDEIEVSEATDESPAMALIRYSLRDTADGMLIVWNVADDLLGAAIVTTATDELADSEAVVLTVVQSVEFHGSIDDLLASAAEEGEGDN